MEHPQGGNDQPARRYEFIGGGYSNYRFQAGPPWIRFVVTPEQLEFHGRGLNLFRIGPWIVPRSEVKEVFSKRLRRLIPPVIWEVEIVTTDPSVWWTFWSPHDTGPVLLTMEECGYPVDWIPHNWAGMPIE